MGCDVCIGTDDFEKASVYNSAMVVARKPHKCCECRAEIKPRERYERVAGLWDGRWEHYRTCAMCVEIRTAFTCDGGWMFGSLWQDMHDYAFPELTLSSDCFKELSAAGKAVVLERWRKWKGI